MTDADFFARQAQLQAEARMALAQAKEMAHMQMEVERQRLKKSPITEMVRSSLEKVIIHTQVTSNQKQISAQQLCRIFSYLFLIYFIFYCMDFSVNLQCRSHSEL
jgi:uncharacterized membrane protein YccC